MKNPATHPEWWGKTFFKHFPNHGFVGDLFTVNGTAYPVMKVERRKYRFRFLDCSVARIYDFQLMSSTQGPKAAKDLGYTGDELQGQYRIPDGRAVHAVHTRSPPTVGCCRRRSRGTTSSCGPPSGAR